MHRTATSYNISEQSALNVIQGRQCQQQSKVTYNFLLVINSKSDAIPFQVTDTMPQTPKTIHCHFPLPFNVIAEEDHLEILDDNSQKN